MRGPAGPTFLVVLLCAPVAAELSRAGEADEPAKIEPSQPVTATSSAAPVTADRICNALAAAAAENGLPVDFLTRLIWQESRFDPITVNRAGAQGVAQFMPATASARGLANPFDPLEAIAQSAKLLRDLEREFGNLGLAAAAYNAGAARVRDWLAGRRALPGETRSYVRIVTGRSAEEWTGGQPSAAEVRIGSTPPCPQVAPIIARGPSPPLEPPDPWRVELVGGSSDETALAAYHRLQEKHAALLADREPHIVHHGRARGSLGWARVHVGADSRASAEQLCTSLRRIGAGCEVQRN